VLSKVTNTPLFLSLSYLHLNIFLLCLLSLSLYQSVRLEQVVIIEFDVDNMCGTEQERALKELCENENGDNTCFSGTNKVDTRTTLTLDGLTVHRYSFMVQLLLH